MNLESPPSFYPPVQQNQFTAHNRYHGSMHTTLDHPYSALTPDVMLDALQAAGLAADGRLLPLNSFENRVVQAHLEDDRVVVAKFYRPNHDGARWSDAQILEEHAFAHELHAAEIPVVAPLPLANGSTLMQHAGFRFAVFPRQGGRAPELEHADTLQWIGRFLGRIHTVGAARPFVHREAVDVATLGEKPLAYLREYWFALDHAPRQATPWLDAAHDALIQAAASFARAAPVQSIRLHGDCHPGNILWTEGARDGSTSGGPHFVDLDDCRTGAALQDFWMLTSGTRAEVTQQLSALLEGYTQFAPFDARQLHLLEALRTLRMIHYSAWLARRWNDPIFEPNFPWFNTAAYWADQTRALMDQCAAMDAPTLHI
jgi:Ser/Thr protein kinase RdoA (MazF antagonist)